jgi:TonB family protein
MKVKKFALKCSILVRHTGPQQQGTTKLSFLVDASGKVSEARVIQKSGNTAEHALLDEEALTIINACRFPEAKGYASVRAIQAFKWALAD